MATNLKILIIGESGVGKSSLLLRFVDDAFDPEQPATIEVDFKIRTMMIDGNSVKLAIWETAGQKRFRTLSPSYYRGAHGAIFVYDVSSRESFNKLSPWLTALEMYSTKSNIVKMLVGNKIDKENRQITREEGTRFARKHQMLFVETSASSPDGVSKVFDELVQKILGTPDLWSAEKSTFQILDNRPRDTAQVATAIEAAPGQHSIIKLKAFPFIRAIPVSIELAAYIANAIRKSAKDNKPSGLQIHEVAQLLKEVHEIFRAESQLIEMPCPMSICGDVHGQVADVVRLFNENAWPPEQRYLFLGDYVDRGPNSIDTILLLFSLKRLYPTAVFLLRGNHETKALNGVYGFKNELQQRFPAQTKPDGTSTDPGKELWLYFNKVFDDMSLAAFVGESVLCMHGGLSPELKNLSDIRDIKKPLSKFPEKGLAVDLLWADRDSNVKGFQPSTRGISYLFGPDAVTDKCVELGVSMVARAHQVVENGYEFFADHQMVTLFTAPDYCNAFTNHGALMTLEVDLSVKIKLLKSQKKK